MTGKCQFNRFCFKISRKTIKRELLNGRYETLTNYISKIALTFSYSADISRFNRIKKYKSKNKQKNKDSKIEKLREFIKNELNNKQKSKSNCWKK